MSDDLDNETSNNYVRVVAYVTPKQAEFLEQFKETRQTSQIIREGLELRRKALILGKVHMKLEQKLV